MRKVTLPPQQSLDDEITKEAQAEFQISVRQLDLTRLTQRFFIAIF
jgi:hypothetical protein